MVVYLVLSVMFSTLFAVCYKIASHKNCNLQIVNTWVYVGSVTAILGSILLQHHVVASPKAVLLGGISGVMSFFATLTFFYHIQYGKLAASWTVISLSLGFPVLASILIWHESPTLKQAVGLVLIVIALLLFGRHEMNIRGVEE